MFRPSTLKMFACLLACGLIARAAEETKDKPALLLGDKAPKIDVRQFVKGEAVTEFKRGKTYVVEFWATWCGPCRESIPHLTKMQKAHDEVTFIGVSIEAEDEDVKTVKAFVAEMGDKMDYRVAIDAPEGKMGTSWLEASSQNGIPCAFIVNGDGQVAWIGHPGAMEKPLEAIIAGKYDLTAEAEKAKKQHEEELKLARAEEARQKEISEALRTGDPRHVLKKLDDLIAGDASTENSLATAKLAMLMSIPDESEKTLEYAKKLVDKTFADDFEQLVNLANIMTEPDAEQAGLIIPKGKKYKPDAKLAKLAVSAAEKAQKLSKDEDEANRAAVAAVLGQSYFADGQTEKAIASLKTAIQLGKTAGSDLREFKDMLKSYEAARDKQPADGEK